MSNFACDKCGVTCQDTPRGYITGCEHYPPNVLSDNQIDGLRCVVCNRDDQPMVPIRGVCSPHESQMFRCENCKWDLTSLEYRLMRT